MVQNSERNAAVQTYAYLVLIAFSLRRHLEMCIGYYNKGYSQKFCDEGLHLMAERLNSCHHHMFQNQWKEVTTEEIWQMCDSSNRNRLKMLLTGMEAISNKLHTYRKRLTDDEKKALRDIYRGMVKQDMQCFITIKSNCRI